MNLLCNIIKSENVKIIGRKKVKNFVDVPHIEDTTIEPSINMEEEIQRIEEEIRIKLEEAENQYEAMINQARLESEKIVEIGKEEALQIEKNAYEEGHTQGLKNGYEDGYKEVYEENIEKAKQEANAIIQNANDLLIQANDEIVNYMKENRKNIINIAVSIAEQVLKDKFEDVDSMDNLLLNVIEEYELKENFVIKVNPIYKESLDKQILELKENYQIKEDVFVLNDSSLEPGNAVIDNVKGSLIIGIDGVLDKIKEELL